MYNTYLLCLHRYCSKYYIIMMDLHCITDIVRNIILYIILCIYILYRYFCERDVDECEQSAPCYNGATCENTHGSYLCHCNNGYSGRHCQDVSISLIEYLTTERF